MTPTLNSTKLKPNCNLDCNIDRNPNQLNPVGAESDFIIADVKRNIDLLDDLETTNAASNTALNTKTNNNYGEEEEEVGQRRKKKQRSTSH